MRSNLFIVTLCSLLLMAGSVLAQEEQADKWGQAGKEIKEAAEAVTEATKDSAEHSWEKTKELGKEVATETKSTSKKLWEKTKEGSKKAWEKTKTTSKKAWDKTKEVTEKTIEGGKAKIHELTAPDQAASGQPPGH